MPYTSPGFQLSRIKQRSLYFFRGLEMGRTEAWMFGQVLGWQIISRFFICIWRLSMISFSTRVGKVAEVATRGISLHSMIMCRSPSSLSSFLKAAQILIQCTSSNMKLISHSTKYFFCNSHSKPPPVLTSGSGLNMTTWYLKCSIAYSRWKLLKRFKIFKVVLMRKFSEVTMSAPIKIAFIPTLSRKSTFCFMRRLRGVMTTWM